jgi:hypothetical protein
LFLISSVGSKYRMTTIMQVSRSYVQLNINFSFKISSNYAFNIKWRYTNKTNERTSTSKSTCILGCENPLEILLHLDDNKNADISLVEMQTTPLSHKREFSPRYNSIAHPCFVVYYLRGQQFFHEAAVNLHNGFEMVSIGRNRASSISQTKPWELPNLKQQNGLEQINETSKYKDLILVAFILYHVCEIVIDGNNQ